jgi:serine/threonine protein kinase
MLSYCNSCKKQVETAADGSSGKSACIHCGAETAMPSMDQLRKGTVINGFMIEEKIGQGGMGIVYKAKQLNLERFVALKVLSDALASDSEFVDRFFKEARAAAGLSHSNIVQVYDAGSTLDGIYYFAMELIEGETLDTRISREGLIPQADALEIALKIASALDYAWEKQKLCHGDIKPDNIILNSSGGAKLADLGLAKSIHDESSFKDGIMATPLYAPPEVISGDIHRIDCRSDMYSFGATLYHMLSGMPPFSGDDPEAVMKKHLNDNPGSLSEVNRELNPAISDLVDQLLLKNPESRPASWKEVCKSLDRIHDFERKVFHKPPKTARILPSPSSVEPPDSNTLLKIIISLSGVIVILVALTVAVYTYKHGGGTSHRGGATVKQGAVHSSTPAIDEKTQEKWLKVKSDIDKTDPETGIVLIRQYVKNNPSEIPPDAEILLLELNRKLAAAKTASENIKMKNESFQKEVADIAALIGLSDLKAMEKEKLEELSKRIEHKLSILSKDTEISISPESRAELKQALLNISDILSKIKAEEEKIAQAKIKAKREQARVEQEKRGKAIEEDEKLRQAKLAEIKLREGYRLLLSDFMISYSKKKEPAYLRKLIEEWLAENKKNAIPESLMVNCAFLLNTVIPSEPLIFSIFEKNEAALRGKSIPGNTSFLKISDEYLIDKISDKSIKLMTSIGKVKMGRTVPLDHLNTEIISQLLQRRILSPDSGIKPSKQDMDIILSFYLLNGIWELFAECLKNSDVFSLQERKIWESVAEDMRGNRQ